jgi:hypothetical protein
MIHITVQHHKDVDVLSDPCCMLKSSVPDGTAFQLHSKGEPFNEYFITCGMHEQRVVHIWFSEEEDCYRLSTSGNRDLKEYLPHVKVKEIKNLILKMEVSP